jgi:hypothetical protein
MRTRRVQWSVLALTISGILAACSNSSSSDSALSVLPARTIDAGEVEMIITPTQFDDQGAAFSISLDTHSADLSIDLINSSVLDVSGTTWTPMSWTGDGPDGHHRSGELRFSAQGPATGTAILTIAGLPEPVTATWELDGG